MRTGQTFSVNFFMVKTKSRNGVAPIFARVTVNGQRADISTQEMLPIEHWGGPKLQAQGTKDAKRINSHLEDIKAGLKESYRELMRLKKPLTAEAVKCHYLGQEHTEVHSLKSMFAAHKTQAQIEELEKGTLKNYSTTEKKLLSFLQSNLNKKDILLGELNYKFVNDFYHFLRTSLPEKKGQKKCGHNAALKHIERLKKMIHMAMKFEWIEKDPFARFTASFSKTDRGFLTEEELNTIIGKNITIDRLQLVRDLFVFSCFTGMAYIDVMHLTKDNLSVGIDGQNWISYSRVKTKNTTNEQASMPLLPWALAIVNKYKDHPAAIQRGALFPSISNQKLNSYLKEIGDICGINKNITFHLARHTFATTVTLANGVPIETVGAMLIHKKLSTTQIYARVIDRKINRDMQMLRDKLNADFSERDVSFKKTGQW